MVLVPKRKKRVIFSYLLILLSTSIFAQTPPPSAEHAMVVSDHVLASQVGVEILQNGGNAVDAAIGVGYALAVVQPCCGNLGGGGFMLIRLADGKEVVINFREKAPLAATSSLFLDQKGEVLPDKSTEGYLAVGVPGTVMGLETAWKKYGSMPRAKLIEPAIRLALHGYILKAGDIKLLSTQTDRFKKEENVAKIFLKNNQPYQVGDRLKQTDLAKTLKLILKEGEKGFYSGSIANDIVKSSQLHGGILSLEDFAQYTVELQEPIHCSYKGYSILSAPPPSSGGILLCEMLNILEGFPLEHSTFHSLESIYPIASAMRAAFADRNKLGDPNFVQNPVASLLSKSYAEKIRHWIKQNRTPMMSLEEENGLNTLKDTSTTHYSVMDKDGNAVSVTYTLNSEFGAHVISNNTGFFLNNEMDDFTTKPGKQNQFDLVQGEANQIQAGKRPLSSMTPTIVLKNNRPFLVIGGVGGPRITTSTLQGILNVVDYKMNIEQAVNAPRFHHQFKPNILYFEPDAIRKEVALKLLSMGFKTMEKEKLGIVEALYIDPNTNMIYGGSDERRSAGKALGY